MWPDSDQTAELLAAAGDGNAVAVNRLLDRHREALRRMVELRMDQALRRRVDASDIVQDVLIEANRRLTEYIANPAMPFHLWLRHIAKDRVIDTHRRHRVAGKRSLDREQPQAAAGLDRSSLDLIAQLRDPEMTPAAAATWHELESRFFGALDQLEEHDREVLLMRHFEQLSNQDVAAALGLTEPAAGMRYLRAMRRLRTLLADPNDTSGDG